MKTNSQYTTAGKIIAVRLFRLGHIPPAQYSTQILCEKGFPVLVVEFGNAVEPLHYVSGSPSRVRLDAPWVKWLPRQLRPYLLFLNAFFKLSFRFLTQGRPQHLIAHGIQEECLVAMLGTVFRIPFSVHVHEAYEPRELDNFTRVLHSVGSRLLRRARILVFPEKKRAELYYDRYKLNHAYHIVYNCPRLRQKGDGVDHRRRLGLPSNAITMAYLGGIGKMNCLEEAILAMAEFPNLHFLLWGWGRTSYLDSLRSLASQIGVIDRVHFLGQLNQDKWPMLDGCDLSYCVYRPDHLRLKLAATASNKLMEALAAGLPVITRGTEDFKEIVEKYQVGVCLKGLSSSDIVTALRQLLLSPMLRKRMGDNGVRAHRETLNFEHQFQPVLIELSRLVRLPPSPTEAPSHSQMADETSDSYLGTAPT